MHLSLVINGNHSKENMVERNRSNPVFQDLYMTAITQNPTSYLGAQLLDSSSDTRTQIWSSNFLFHNMCDKLATKSYVLNQHGKESADLNQSFELLICPSSNLWKPDFS